MNFFKSGLALLLLLVSFQNCSDVNVSQMPSLPPPPIAPLAKDTVNLNLCPIKANGVTSKLRLVFVVDMSLSNLAEEVQGEADSCVSGQYKFRFTVPGSDPSANDPLRLKAISTFISSINGNVNSDLKYAVMGFSRDAMMGNPILSCEAALTSNLTDVFAQINGLKGIQALDAENSERCFGWKPFVMSTTSYFSGLKCLRSAVDDDMVFNTEQAPFYQVFFLTDGQPTESSLGGNNVDYSVVCKDDPGCQARMQSCISGGKSVQECLSEVIYAPKLASLLNSLRAENASISLKPLYYGKASERESAVRALDIMAKAVDPLAYTEVLSSDNSAGGTNTLITDLVNQFRNSLEPQAYSNYSFKMPMAINLTAMPKGGKLVSDTDADGVSDEIELSLGWDIKNPRSQGILDGLCYHFFDAENCAPPTGAICSTEVGFGLTNCDQEKAKLIWGSTNLLTGLDSDKDGLIDYIEIIRGTNPMVNDSNSDADRDTVKNIVEIVKGTDPQSVEKISSDQLTSLLANPVFYSQSECTFEGQGMHSSLENTSFVLSEDYRTGKEAFRHTAKENLVLVTMVADLMGSSSPNQRKLYTLVLRLNSDGKYNKLDIKNGDLTAIPGEF